MGFSHYLFSFLFSTLIFFSNSAHSQQNFELLENSQNSIVVSPYDYPIHNPYIATMSYLATRPAGTAKYKILAMNLHPERAGIHTYGNDYILNLAFFGHDDNPNAPLIFIVPGIGGSPLKPSTIYLGESLYNLGFNVLTLPSTLSKQFSYNVSRSGLPGFSVTDAEDMLVLMKSAENILRKNAHINPSKYAIMGFSLGALDSSFIANFALQNHIYNFERVLMINPPIQKNKSINILDSLTNGISNFSVIDQANLLSAAATSVLNANFFSFDKIFSFNFEYNIGFSNPQMAWLIGTNFRRTLGDVILMSQEIDDQGILRTPSNSLLRGLRQAEAYTFNFRAYIDQFVFNKMKNNQIVAYNFNSPDELINQSDMRSQLESLTANNVRWAIFHNENDFIFHKGDLEYLMNSKSDSRIYPLGGHLGNLWFEQNRQDLLSFLAPVTNQ